MIPNNATGQAITPKLASIANSLTSSFNSNVPFIDVRSRLSDLSDGLPYLSTAPMVWTLNSVRQEDLEGLYRRYVALEAEEAFK